MLDDIQKLTRKKRELDRLLPRWEIDGFLDDWFTVELTYTSNAIEGNTLTRQETALILEKGIAAGGKSLREHREVLNHADAVALIRALAARKDRILEEGDIMRMHQMMLAGIDDKNAGFYRIVPVRISGSAVTLPNAMKVPALMEEFVRWLKGPHDVHPAQVAAEAHYRFVSIHPFVDGNGRTGRLLMNYILMQKGYPPAIIRKEERLAYLNALETAQLGGPREIYDRLMLRAVGRSLDIYLKTAKNKDVENLGGGRLLKIGALARAAGESVPTIRFWTKEGLLDVAEITAANYHLYAPEMVARCREIKKLKEQRLTLREIGERVAR
jgi:Fic family protein